MSRHTPIENQWEATWIHWTPVYLEHWTPNLFPQATFTCLLWTFCTDLKLFNENEENEIYKINCFVNWYFSKAEHVKFLIIWRKWGKDRVDFAIKWYIFSNYPWFCLSFTRSPNTQNLDTLNTCVHWTLFHFPWVFNVDRFHCSTYVCSKKYWCFTSNMLWMDCTTVLQLLLDCAPNQSSTFTQRGKSLLFIGV